MQTVEMIEHIQHEKAEIVSIQHKITDLSVENLERTQSPKQDLHSAAISYLGKVENISAPQSAQPQAGPAEANTTPQIAQQKPVAVAADDTEDSQESDWLKRMTSI